MRLKHAPLLAATVAGSGGVCLAGHLNDSPEIIWIFQPLTIGLIVWAAWRRGLLADHYVQFITLGLALSLIADTVRLVPDQVLISASLFILALLSYLWAFTANHPLTLKSWPPWLAALIAVPVAAVILPALPGSHLLPAAGGMLVGVLMIGQAAARTLALPATERMMASRSVAGAALLLASMAALLVNRYVHELPGAILWEMIPYWAGQTLLAVSITERHPDLPTVG